MEFKEITDKPVSFKELVQGRLYNMTINGRPYEFKAMCISKDIDSLLMIGMRRKSLTEIEPFYFRVNIVIGRDYLIDKAAGCSILIYESKQVL